MKNIVMLMLLVANSLVAQQIDKTFDVENFDKIIISPHIAVNLIEGNEESVRIDEAGVVDDKINIEVEGTTLRIYLDGAKMVTKSEKGHNDMNMGKSLYDGTQVRATITYKTLNSLSVRGEERINAKSKIDQKEFTLRIYGESQVYLTDVALDRLKVTIYGESYFEVENGMVQNQRFITYGESKVNTIAMNNELTKITAYGESDIRVNVAKKLKVTCYGETHITYQGSPNVNRGIVIGEATILKIG
ncbi:DUF2807 domain-containing protein [Aurantibacter crassamenti]|uniref:head GIN domain-containing protein n=1 Tax=Aurantibacter crassamenti TaxID=1837375 RepID=UPI00193AA565|nr:head GIN domain-containing protein [Aurantibacter crassamenti]MBM1104845.1 DUF2807 domain-containing protein [Aurantibacter crassamenti]